MPGIFCLPLKDCQQDRLACLTRLEKKSSWCCANMFSYSGSTRQGSLCFPSKFDAFPVFFSPYDIVAVSRSARSTLEISAKVYQVGAPESYEKSINVSLLHNFFFANTFLWLNSARSFQPCQRSLPNCNMSAGSFSIWRISPTLNWALRFWGAFLFLLYPC